MAAIEIDGLTKDYGAVLAADDLSFTVDRGEIFGYLGPNGAGKTTTIRMLLGFIRPTAGTARILGTDIRDRDALVAVKRRLGYLSDEPGFDEEATGQEILDLHAAVKGDSRSEELLELFDPPLDRPIRDYSRGNVQKLGLVTTFMHDPELVILDEPTSGLDPLMRQRFAEFLREERAAGTTVFFSSHVLSEVRRLCDRAGIIRGGRLLTIEPIDALVNRSGKVVRLHAAAPIPRDVLDVEGVHDLQTTVGADPGDADATGIPTQDPEEADALPEGADAVPEEADAFTECAFTFTGDVNDLLPRLAEYDLRDLSIEEAPLEDVFMRFYGEETDV